LNGLSVSRGALTSLCRYARLGLHQIADDVGRFDERARREVIVGVNLPLSRAQRRSNCID